MLLRESGDIHMSRISPLDCRLTNPAGCDMSRNQLQRGSQSRMTVRDPSVKVAILCMEVRSSMIDFPFGAYSMSRRNRIDKRRIGGCSARQQLHDGASPDGKR